MSNETKNTLDQAKADLKQLRDELKVRVHLAKKDAETAWKDIEPAFGKLERKLEDAARVVEDTTEKARLQAKLGLAEVKAQWPGFEKAIEQITDDVKKGAADLKTGIDTARVKAHLAQMDAAEKATANQDEFKKASADLQAEIEKAANEIKSSFLSLKKRISG